MKKKMIAVLLAALFAFSALGATAFAQTDVDLDTQTDAAAAANQHPPEMPEGGFNGQQPPEMPEGGFNGQQPPEMPPMPGEGP